MQLSPSTNRLPQEKARAPLSIRARLALFLLLLAPFVPTVGFCVEEDPYIYKSMVGRVLFELENIERNEDTTETKTDKFTQIYSLDLKGNIGSRRFLIYDAGVALSNTDYETNGTENGTRSINYYLSTTILPKSSIPFTLYGTNTNDTNSSSAGDTDTQRTTYGMRWFLKLRTLPETNINVERSHAVSDGSDFETTLYRTDIKKELGRTVNELHFDLTQKDDKVLDSGDTSDMGLNYTNRTNISKRTYFFLGASRSVTNTETTDTKVKGITFNLNSKPSIDFSQSHNFSWYKSEADGSMEGSSYSGNMQYTFTNRLNSSLSLSAGTTNNESSTSTYESENLSSVINTSYILSKNLYLSEVISYSEVKTNSTDTAFNIGDSKVLRVTTNVNYTKPLSWAILQSAVGVGYTDEKSTSLQAGKGIEYNFLLALNDINVNPYVGFSTSANYSFIDSFSGDIGGRTIAYSLDAFNKVWKKYVTLTGRYSKSDQSSYLDAADQKSELYRFDTISSYFKNTKLQLYAERNNSFNEAIGFSTNDIAGVSAARAMNLLGGALDITASYELQDSRFTGGTDRSVTATYSGRYTKTLLKNTSWQFLAQRNESKTTDSFSKVTYFENSLLNPLRSWVLSLEHRYTINEDNNLEYTESRILFRAARQFVRIW